MRRALKAAGFVLWPVAIAALLWWASNPAADLPTPRIAYASCSDDASCFVRMAAVTLPPGADFVAVFILATPTGPVLMQHDGDRGARRFRFAPLPCYESWLGDSKVPKLQRSGTYYLVAQYAASVKVEGGWNTLYGPVSAPVPVTWKGPITCP